MKVAVLSLCRDRLAYSQACFAALREYAGCDFDHYVLDQASADGTAEWLREDGVFKAVVEAEENVGIHRGLNVLLDVVDASPVDYDVVVNMDNDCELTVPGTLKAVAEVHMIDPTSCVGPVVNGLRNPVAQGAVREIQIGDDTWDSYATAYRVAETGMIGGILMPLPHGWRYPEHTGPPNGDSLVSAQAAWCGQLIDYPVNHYRTTDGQHEDFPEYFRRRVAEGTPD